jgi:predicted outer membrane repeat protein
MRAAAMGPLVFLHLLVGCGDDGDGGDDTTPNSPPTITITSPTDGQPFVYPATVTVAVQVSDPNDGPTELLLSWSGSAITTGTPQRADANGVATLDLEPQPGSYDVTVSVADPDGETDSATVLFSVAPDADNDGYGPDDCDDTNADIHPGATEICNGIDDNCADGPDDGLTFESWYTDADDDGFGDATTEVVSCEDLSTTHILDGTDCDDNVDTTFPGAEELCNGVDDDCANGADDGLVFMTWYEDADGDDWGNPAIDESSCDDLSGTHSLDNTDCDDGSAALNHDDGDGDGTDTCAGDCNDGDAAIEPGAAETCNGIDDNCAGGTDEGFPTTDWYADTDQDGYGNAGALTATCLDLSATHSLDATDCDDTDASLNHDDADEDGIDSCTGDCNDTDPAILPGATEVCNGIDDNCADGIDEGTERTDWFTDADQDGYGDPTSLEESCDDLSATHVLDGTDCDDSDATLNHDDEDVDGFTSCLGDCDDLNAAVNPGASEICNGIDDDCDAATTETATVNGVGYASLSDAVTDAPAGGTVELCEGLVFTSEVSVVDKVLTIIGAGPDQLGTTLDGSGAPKNNALIVVLPGGELHLQTLTITGAKGGAVKGSSTGGVISADDVWFLENDASGNGGAVTGTTITITNSTFTNNTATDGGAIFAMAGGALTVTDSLFEGNTATSDGGAFHSASPVVFTGVDVIGNVSNGTLVLANGGGGGVVTAGAKLATFTDTLFSSNFAGGGGALWVIGASVEADDLTTFEGNLASNLGTSYGGGVLMQAAGNAVTWTGGVFLDNVSDAGGFAAGGGMVLDANDSGAAQGSIVASEIVLDGNATVGPVAASTGGGIWTQGSPITLMDILTMNNTSDYGGGTSLNSAGGGLVTLERVEYRANVGLLAGATDIYDADVEMTDCIIEENVGGIFGGVQYGALLVDFNGTLAVIDSNLGVAPNDNAPFDVLVNAGGLPTYSYGDGVSFFCDIAVPSCI